MSRPIELMGRRRDLWRFGYRVGFHCLLWSLVLVVLVPLIWPLMMAMNQVSVESLVDHGVLWWLRGVELEVVTRTALNPGFRHLLMNSALVATASALISAGFAALAAYGMTRFRFFGRRSVGVGLLVLLMVPQTVVAIPLFLVFHTIGLHDTRTALIATYVAYTLPFTVWLLIPLFGRIPSRYEDAALVDGSTRFGAFVRVFLPIAKPAVAAAFAFGWILSYNEFLYAVALIDDPAKRTLPVGLRFSSPTVGVIAVVATLPIIAIFAVLWRYFLKEGIDQFNR